MKEQSDLIEKKFTEVLASKKGMQMPKEKATDMKEIRDQLEAKPQKRRRW